MKRLVIVALVLLSGCTHYSAHKDGLSDAQMTKDGKDCAYDAAKAVAGDDNPLIARSKDRELIAMCLRSKGYTVTQN